MNKILMLERFAAQSLIEYDGELIFSKEKFAELIVQECVEVLSANRFDNVRPSMNIAQAMIKQHFGVEE